MLVAVFPEICKSRDRDVGYTSPPVATAQLLHAESQKSCLLFSYSAFTLRIVSALP